VQASFESPIEFALVHVGGTSVVLEATRKLGIRRFVYISSAEVYGRTERLPVAEDHPLEARSPYAAAKIGAEQFVQASTFSTGIEAIVLRPFSIYGPGSSCQSLIGTILRQARDQDCLTLNDLRPVRDYCHVEDLAEAVVRACTAPTSGFCVVNVGTGLGTSVIDLARLILSALGRDIPVREAPGSRRPPESEIYHLIANPRKAYEVLGWKAEVTLQAGLKQLCTLRRAPD
jgi:UDP-glucose 4-epimerase